MSQETEQESERKELPIERGFPIERVNEIASRENQGGAREYYRPTYSMHKWWARRAGSAFRAICLYSLIDGDSDVSIRKPGAGTDISDFGGGPSDVERMAESVDLSDPESLWDLYKLDTKVEGKKVLDPFMRGGTSVGEASRFGAEVDGRDLNPVAWFVTKKEMEAHETDPDDIREEYERITDELEDELKGYYRRPCPNDPSHDTGVMYYLWVKELDCVSCDESVPLFKDYRVGRGRYGNKGKYNVLCPDCGSVVLVDDWQTECSCSECANEFVPKEGNVRGSNYICPSCGQKYGITDAIQEQDGFDIRLCAFEYYCAECDSNGEDKTDYKAYAEAEEVDRELFEEARREWEESDELREYVPDEEIRYGHMTGERNDVFAHGYENWTDMFNERQLLSLSKLLRSIDKIEDESVREYLLLALSETLKRNNMMTGYNYSHNGTQPIFKSNSFDPPQRPAEGNVWGLKHGAGVFYNQVEKMISGVEYAHAPTERYMEDGEMVESEPFETPLGGNTQIEYGDAREIDAEDEYDAVITDPPYYDNIIYSELSDLFYVWQKVLLEDEYECFEADATPRADSIVANPAEDKGEEEFEDEIRQAFDTVHTALKEDGVLAFTYHHSDAESWGELLTALCDVAFEVTATYPITADVQRLTKGESVEFDIVVVARPVEEEDRKPTSWNSLRRDIFRTAEQVRERLESERDLSEGDIGVIEMGRCFHEYSKHHGKVQRDGATMSAKDVVDEIYGIISGDIGEIDVYLDLLETEDASYSDLNKLCKTAGASPELMEEMKLYHTSDGFELGTWRDEERIAYVRQLLSDGGPESLTRLDKAHLLRHRFERGLDTTDLVGDGVGEDLRKLCERLASATDDEAYTRMLEMEVSEGAEDTELDDY